MLSPEARRREIKLASADLVRAVGGLEAAAGLAGLGKSQVHRCVSVNDDSSFFNVAVAGDLEQRSDRPFVTIALAKLAGGVFIRLPEPFDDGADLALRVIDLVQELGDVSARVREALADGVVRPPEARAIERELDQLIEKSTETRAIVRALQISAEARRHDEHSAAPDAARQRAPP